MTAPGLERHASWALPLLAAAAWLPSLANGFVWDDRMLIVDNPALLGPGAVARAFGDFWSVSEQASGYWRPLVALRYAFEAAAWGLRPLPFHATNVALHVAVVALLARWLTRWGAPPAALIGAAWFAAHPAFAESVAWISGRTDAMAMAFALVALLADRSRPAAAARALSVGGLALALMAKEVAIVVPLVAIAADVGAGRSPREAARDRLDLLAVIGVYLAARVALVGLPAPADVEMALSTRLAALPHLIGLLALPWVGRAEYGAGLPADPLVPAAVAGVALVVGLAAAGRSDRKIAALLAGGLLLYLPNALVALSRGVVGERLAYAPGALLLPALAIALARAPRGAAAGVLAVLLATTWAKQGDYRSDLVLFARAAREPHPSARSHLNYGLALHDAGRLVEARDHLERAEAASPIDQAPYMLGLLYDEIGCAERAEAGYRRALAIDPGYSAAAGNLAGLLATQGRGPEAKAVVEASLLAREDETLRRNLAVIGAVGGQRAPDPAGCATDPGVEALMTDRAWLERRAARMERMGRADGALVLRRAIEAR